jgi:hypothetical protein
MLEILVLSMTTACLSFTISESALVRPLRAWLARRSAVAGRLACCGYCLGHWIALALVLVYQPGLVSSRFAVLDLLVEVLPRVVFGISTNSGTPHLMTPA